MQGYLLGGRPIKVNVAVARPNEALPVEPAPRPQIPARSSLPAAKRKKTEAQLQAEAAEAHYEMMAVAAQYLQPDVQPAPGSDGWDYVPFGPELLAEVDVDTENELFLGRRQRMLQEDAERLSRVSWGIPTDT